MVRLRRTKPPAAAPTDAEHAAILAALGRLEDMSVREVMTPRVDVVALKSPVSAEDVALAVKQSGHSRFPVYETDLDDLVGVLFVKDLFRSGGVVRLRQPFVVPETAAVLSVLSAMRVGRNAFAVVVDEHGGVEGVLTVKDLVSELVGELPDEFDRPDEVEISRVDSSRWLVEGACPVDRLVAELGPLGLSVPEGEYVTVGGFLFDRFGRIPGEGDMLVHEGWEFRVTEMDRRRIAQTVVRAPSGTMDDGLSGGAPGSVTGTSDAAPPSANGK